MKTKLIALFLLLFVAGTHEIQAQLNECSITYAIDVQGGDMDAQTAAMMKGMTITMMFKDDKVRTESNMSMGTSTTIMDGANKKGVVLTNMMGMKMAIPMGAEAFDDTEEAAGDMPEIKWTGKTKEIAGYTCKQAIMKQDGEKVEMWVSDEIAVNAAGTEFNYAGMNGFPLEMDTKQDGTTMHMTATEVSTDKLDSDLFEVTVPAGYQEMDPNMLKNMGGGR